MFNVGVSVGCHDAPNVMLHSTRVCPCREIDALKTQLRRAHEEKELRSKQQSNPAHEQELQTARAHAQQAAAASAQHVKELTALKGGTDICPFDLSLITPLCTLDSTDMVSA